MTDIEYGTKFKHSSVPSKINKKYVIFAYISILLAVMTTVLINLWLYTTLFTSKISFSSKSLLEKKGVLLGATIDWSGGDSPRDFGNRIGHNPGVISFFVEMQEQIVLRKELKSVVEKVLQVPGSALALTVLPTGGLTALNTGSLQQIAAVAAAANSYGASVLLRFGHEMNGNWYPWGQRPIAYKRAFKMLAQIVRRVAPQTYLVWAPNTGIYYPWGGLVAGSSNAADLKELDTNGNGVLDEADDPYTPYYPGDEHVDIVGASLFSMAKNSLGEAANTLPVTGLLYDSLIRTQGGAAAIASNGNKAYSLYAMFSEAHSKPFALMETAGAFYPDVEKANPGGASEIDLKTSWMAQVFNTTMLQQTPNFKLIMWFDVRKNEEIKGIVGASGVKGVDADYVVTKKPELLKVFKSYINAAGSGIIFNN